MTDFVPNQVEDPGTMSLTCPRTGLFRPDGRQATHRHAPSWRESGGRFSTERTVCLNNA